MRRLEIDTLQIGTINVLRRPLPTEQSAPVPDEPLLPELPLKLIVKEFSLEQLVLGETVIGTAARLSATGNATLGNPAEGLNLRFDARRLDAAGSLMARLDLVPQTQRLDLQLGVDEPANGVAAHALNIPGLPPVKLDLNGTGTLDAFDARLTFDAGPSIGANGAAQLRRENTNRRLNLNMAARIEGLLPTLAAPVFAGTTQLNSDITFADSGAITIAPLSVVSQTARLDINGSLSPEQVADLKITARSVPNAGDKTAAAGTEIRSLVFDAAVAGPIMGPRIDATLDAQDIVIAAGPSDARLRQTQRHAERRCSRENDLDPVQRQPAGHRPCRQRSVAGARPRRFGDADRRWQRHRRRRRSEDRPAANADLGPPLQRPHRRHGAARQTGGGCP